MFILSVAFTTPSLALNRFDFNTNHLSLSAVEIKGTGFYQAELKQTGDPEFQFQLQQLNPIADPGSSSATYLPESQILTVPDITVNFPDGHSLVYQLKMQLIPGSDPIRLLLLQASTPQEIPVYDQGLNETQGLLRIDNRELFKRMADVDTASATVTHELKFLISEIQRDQSIAWLQNTNRYPLHADFAINVLNWYPDLSGNQATAIFNAGTYFSDNRQNLAGSIVYHENYQSDNGQTGIYTLEFWATDPVNFDLIEAGYRIISAALPISSGHLHYHPLSDTQEQLYFANQSRYADAKIPVILNEQLLTNNNFAILTTGEAYGLLRVISPESPAPSAKDIVIYTFVPNTLSHVAGIITDTPQTPLSHINLKARQNNTPNAYLKAAAEDPAITPLINQWVHYQVHANGIVLEPTSQQQAEAWLESIRPKTTQTPEGDLNITEPQPLSILGFEDWSAFGVKAANVAELAKILPAGVAPDGYAVPFALYNEYMDLPRCGQELTQLCNNQSGTSFYQQAEQMLVLPGFSEDINIRIEALKALRKRIEAGDVPVAMTDKLEAVRLFWEPAGPPFKRSLRTRSSTNNEDLPSFNGAGLYNSYTHKASEGLLINSIKQVWAGLWTDRAFEERDFYRIDHFKTYMGVLIHPNYGDEQANGVAVSRNSYNPDWEGFYINAQYGEISITNPEPIESENGLVHAVPDEIILSLIPASFNRLGWDTQYLRHSNVENVYDQPVSSDTVLTEPELIELREYLQLIHDHFKNKYQGEPDFAMEIEFKITETNDGSRGQLAIKQARPWID